MSGGSPGSGYDCVVIGAGHNGLSCAAYLARAGRSVLVVEAGEGIGGAAGTREFAPGFRVSGCAHLLHSMPEELRRDLALEAHGLSAAAVSMPTTALLDDAAPLAIDPAGGGIEASAHAAYDASMRRLAAALVPALLRTPPRLGTANWSDRMELLRFALRLRRLGRRDMRELLRIGAMNVFDLLHEHFESQALRGALAFDAVLGSNLGPRSPGTVFTLLYRLAGQIAAGGSGLTQPRGGMGAVCDALAAAAKAAGAVVRTSAPVVRITVDGDRATGVELEGGERIGARAVVSSADPQTTLLRLLGAGHLDAGFVRRVVRLRTRGLAAKLHLALDRLPDFSGLDPQRLKGRLLIAPSLRYVEHAYDHAKYGECSAAPIMEITVPTVNDSTLAPPGRHVLSAIVQYAPYALNGGWDAGRTGFTELTIDTLVRHAPQLRRAIVAAELLAPPDIEREFRITGGHWHHADLALDQFYFTRPVPGASQYRAPLPGLFLCGAGCPPGGGVIGAAGRNAARQITRGGH
ncbi:MAG TPA: NAD(P)/FAD-dependent oxidoreductase [Steroidobacteraceae bacterium]|nr:NAD(P)/FAD-dependent oxidoreductase [Steroidobacteraceae bacterium]